ncbi:MAG: hypothetical protein IPN17_24435 [Deltaproteobacteria bacterium]|nr:hypothetical protein [Deltaproteobacteria bacterium]
MSPSSLTAAARHAGAEPLWTGRPRAYAESTLRQAADRLDAEGAWAHVAHAVRAQVEGAVAKVDGEVIAHTDMLDQPYFTKKLAHAAPIGRLGNRLLGCAYFGLTTVALPGGPTLFAHLSWHKPAAPLRDALEDLFDDEARLGWWHEHVRLHIVDRGANGDPVLRWLWSWEVPYLTIGHRGAELWRFHAPTLRNAHALPIVVRPDRRLGGDAADGPWEVIVPAQPDDPDATRGIRFRSAVAFTEAELLSLNALYKSRWPSMENELKALQSQGFGRNRTRRLELVVSRGTDGEVTRLREREARWRGKVRELEAEPPRARAVGRLIAAAGKVEQARAKQAAVVAAAPLKHARVEGGAERLGKWLHLLVHNAMALALATSPDEEVRVMAPTTVGELLLGQSALTVVETERLTMWVDALDAAEDRRRQAALVEVFNNLGLRCRGSAVLIHLHQRPAERTS